MDGTLLSRYECKYLVTPAMTDRLRDAISPFVRPDAFAARRPDHRYLISSLYLDDPGFALYRSTVEGHRNRFKLRIRSYADGEDEPLFCEIKRRVGTIVSKTRSRCERARVVDFLSGTGGCDGFELFGDAVESVMARPVARIRYQREAYESSAGDPVRITFDTDLCFAWTRDYEFSVATGDWHEAQPEGVILEVKFTEMYPSWLDRLFKSFDLQSCSVAKYVMSVDAHRAEADAVGELG